LALQSPAKRYFVFEVVTTNLVIADATRAEKTKCLIVSPSIKILELLRDFTQNTFNEKGYKKYDLGYFDILLALKEFVMKKTIITMMLLVGIALLCYGCASTNKEASNQSLENTETEIQTTGEMIEEKKEISLAYTLPEDHNLSRFLTLVYTEAFSRLGLSYQIEFLPPERASELANSGVVDGEVNRVWNYNETYTNLIRVEASNMIIRFSAFSTDPDLHLVGWESLENTSYIVEYRQGVQKSEIMLPKYILSENLAVTSTIENAIQHLIDGRTDIYVDVENSVEGYLSTETNSSYSEVFNVGVMEQTTGHLFLHKQHSDLANELNKVLVDMKANGLFEQYLLELGLTQYDIIIK